MDEQIKALLNQVRILEEEANKHSGAERSELFKAAAKVKMEVIKLLPKQGQQQESKIPDPNDYFGAKLPEGFENYFDNYLTDEQKSYFDNLTQEQRDYFTVQVPDNAPSAPKKEPDKTKVFDDWEYRRKVLNALGIPC
ncbi:hypothetical protein [Escherichia coli]|uniref:hypothetical protein n=1 Tax=Escherichia coli TaxID=562 RepID=UPI0010200242|nr:hypothetical protein [Escherichia coli]